MVAIAITTMLAVLGSVELARRVNDAAAEATGRYLLAVRDALVDFQIHHEAWLHGVDITAAPPGTYPAAPSLTWAPGAGGVQLAHGTVALLKAEKMLSTNQPDHSPLGERAQFLLVRQGVCPGPGCSVESYVYTCHPISSQRSSRTFPACGNPTGQAAQYDPGLLGQVMSSSDGYGGHDALVNNRFVGSLVNANKAWFGLSTNRGYAVVVGTLGATPFGQFVRMGDTRHVHLRDRLTVSGVIQTDAGLVLNTNVSPGSSCSVPRMFAATSANELAVCSGGVWTVSGGQAVQGVFDHLVSGAYVAPPVCQAPAVPYRYVSLSATDVLVTGADLDIHGDVAGGISGTGTVNAAGNVSLTGTFDGNFQSASTSTVRVNQAVTINAANRIEISPAGPNARASVIQGCAQ